MSSCAPLACALGDGIQDFLGQPAPPKRPSRAVNPAGGRRSPDTRFNCDLPHIHISSIALASARGHLDRWLFRFILQGAISH
jgi:hypothetical protein